MGELFKNIINKLKETNKFNWLAPWNNQFERMQNEEGYAIMNPSCYVELNTTDQHQLLKAYQGYDIEVIIHVISEELDAGDGDIDAFYSIYELRDEVVKALSLFNFEQGGFLQKISEVQDYSHTNLYHYMITYRGHYIDKTAVLPDITISGVSLTNTITINKQF